MARLHYVRVNRTNPIRALRSYLGQAMALQLVMAA
jgi:hypothetical protein